MLGLGLTVQSVPVMGKTLVQRAIAILRRPGIEAHVYLPGIGTLSGLQAANYLDSVGTTLATVDQPVGLVLDAAGSLGVELVTNGDFSAGTTGWTLNKPLTLATSSIVNGTYSTVCNSDNYCGPKQGFALVVGRTYKLTLSVSKGTCSQNINVNVLGAANSLLGFTDVASTSKSAFFTPTVVNCTIEILANGNAATGEFFVDNISVREVTGIHASQPTTAAKPRLERGVRNLAFPSAALTAAATYTTTGAGDVVTYNYGVGYAAGMTSARLQTGVVARVLRWLAPGCGIDAVSTNYCVSFYYRGTLAKILNIAGRAGAGSVTPIDLGAVGPNGLRRAYGAITSGVNATAFLDFTIDANADIEIGDIQVEKGSIASDYSPTTTAAASNPSAGKYSWAFDGGDSLGLGSVPFQMSDDHFVIAGAKVASSSASVQAIAWPSAGAATARYCALQIIPSAGTVGVVWFDGTNANTIYHTEALTTSNAFVLSGMKVGSAGAARLNGLVVGSLPTLTATGVATVGAIGARPSSGINENFVGSTGPIIAGKGALTASEMLTLERLVASLTPNAPQF